VVNSESVSILHVTFCFSIESASVSPRCPLPRSSNFEKELEKEDSKPTRRIDQSSYVIFCYSPEPRLPLGSPTRVRRASKSARSTCGRPVGTPGRGDFKLDPVSVVPGDALRGLRPLRRGWRGRRSRRQSGNAAIASDRETNFGRSTESFAHMALIGSAGSYR
jgi:hypothetical protein